MQTQDKEITPIATSVQKSRRVPWLTGLSVLIVLTLLTGLGVTVLAYSRILHTSTTIPKAGTWQRVLNGYSLMSLTAASNNPAVLYACGTPFHSSTAVPYRPSQPIISYTVLRSSDSGTTWHEVTNSSVDCQVVINPAQGDDIYIIGLAGHFAGNGQVPSVLRHSTDGGHSWTDIAPTMNTGNSQLSIAWNVQQLTRVGNSLFGIQLLPTARVHPIEQPSPVGVVTRLDLSRLVESSDGGHTWSIVDGNLNVTGQGTYGYVVSPSDSQTVYELVGSGWFPYGTPLTPENTSAYSGNLTLYKTTNGGGTWTKLRENIQYGGQIQVASNDPSLVYLSESATRVPLREQGISPIQRYSSLSISKDGGTTWYTVDRPAGTSLVQNWFVSVNGQVYAEVGVAVSGQPTGTVVPNDTKPVGAVASGNSRVTIGDVATIQRYDVASNTWSTVTKTPSSGALLAVTASVAPYKTALWFLSDADNAQVLYKETR